jgi:hypothetical protein
VAPSDRKLSAAATLILLVLAAPTLALAGPSSPTPVPLASGKRGSYSWSVNATRLAGSSPCLSVAITHHHGPFSYDGSGFSDCVHGSPGLRPSTAPLLVGGSHLGGADGSKMTVLGILAAAGTRRVRVTVSDGVGAVPVTAHLEAIALRSNRARRLRFAVIALPGRHCIERLATKSVGRTLWRGAPTQNVCGDPEATPE